LFGTARLGLNIPAYAEDRFNAGLGWDLDPSGDQTIVGGHDVPLVHYDAKTPYCVTWGRRITVSWAFLAAFLDEAHAEVYDDFLTAAGATPAGFGKAQLLADLRAVAAAP
jgi:hypothetical protein